ncbi:uncharacterized protein LOC119170248 isoform X1 [Rhipicephalus microplus]|uniref:uncharacterized protein LOC119170248 isoform X1 n=1 Tax=Rhipicephalus microplus TaxID=6941 RepID=UPI003F6D3DAC
MDSTRSWLVAAGCCWVNVFFVVVYRSAAIVYVGIIDTFHVTREEAIWPGTLSVTCYFTAALVAGIVARYVAVWKITFTACLVAAIAVSLCFFATGVTYLALLYGVVHGWSVGHVTLSNTVINQHFNKYRAVASGLNLAGLSLGGLIFPPVLQYAIDEFGFRGSFLIAGGTILNGTIGTLLQRIPAPKQPDQTDDKLAESSEVGGRIIRESGTACVNWASDCDVDKNVQVESTRSVSVLDGTDCIENVNGESCGRGSLKLGVENGCFEPCETTYGYVSVEVELSVLCRVRFSSTNERSGSLREVVETRRRAASAMTSTTGATQVLCLREHIDHENTQDRGTLSQFIANNAKQTCSRKHSRNELSASRAEVTAESEERTPPEGLKSKLLVVKELLSFLALTEFYAVVLAKIVIITNASVFSTIIIDFALDRGIDRWKALTLISAFTVTDLTARLSSGWITDRKIFSRSTFMALCLASWTCVNICFAYLDSYVTLLILSGVAGWCNGSTQPLIPVLFSEVVDIDRFSVAYGFSSFIVGLTALLRPSVTGKYRLLPRPAGKLLGPFFRNFGTHSALHDSLDIRCHETKMVPEQTNEINCIEFAGLRF